MDRSLGTVSFVFFFSKNAAREFQITNQFQIFNFFVLEKSWKLIETKKPMKFVEPRDFNRFYCKQSMNFFMRVVYSVCLFVFFFGIKRTPLSKCFSSLLMIFCLNFITLIIYVFSSSIMLWLRVWVCVCLLLLLLLLNSF